MIGRVIALVVSLALAAVTGPKLIEMAQIRGWLPGAIVEQQVVTQKWHQTSSEDDRGRDTYWISWGPESIRAIGSHRLNLTREQWDATEIGETLEVIRIPGDRWPHTRDGIFAAGENFVFDIGLLIVELGVAGTMTWQLWQLRKRKRDAEDRPDDAY